MALEAMLAQLMQEVRSQHRDQVGSYAEIPKGDYISTIIWTFWKVT